MLSLSQSWWNINIAEELEISSNELEWILIFWWRLKNARIQLVTKRVEEKPSKMVVKIIGENNLFCNAYHICWFSFFHFIQFFSFARVSFSKIQNRNDCWNEHVDEKWISRTLWTHNWFLWYQLRKLVPSSSSLDNHTWHMRTTDPYDEWWLWGKLFPLNQIPIISIKKTIWKWLTY